MYKIKGPIFTSFNNFSKPFVTFAIMDQLIALEEDTEITKIAELTTESKKWTIRAMLLETSCVRRSKNNEKRYKRFVFVDGEVFMKQLLILNHENIISF